MAFALAQRVTASEPPHRRRVAEGGWQVLFFLVVERAPLVRGGRGGTTGDGRGAMWPGDDGKEGSSGGDFITRSGLPDCRVWPFNRPRVTRINRLGTHFDACVCRRVGRVLPAAEPCRHAKDED
ncbi:hypothetical protein MRX96_055640 [Rhipicephalus microplus]